MAEMKKCEMKILKHIAVHKQELLYNNISGEFIVIVT